MVRVRPAFAGDGRYFVRVPKGATIAQTPAVVPCRRSNCKVSFMGRLHHLWPLPVVASVGMLVIVAGWVGNSDCVPKNYVYCTQLLLPNIRAECYHAR